MVSSWGFRQADHAVFGLQAEADHGTIDAESHSSRAVNRRIIDTSGSMGLFPNTHAGTAASQVRQKQQQQRQRPASAGASAPGLTTSSSLPSMGVSANDLKNAILARSAVASSGTWVDAGATGTCRLTPSLSFSRDPLIYQPYHCLKRVYPSVHVNVFLFHPWPSKYAIEHTTFHLTASLT